MICNLVTQKAKTIKSLVDEGILDDNLNVLKEPEFYDASGRIKGELENVLGSKIPSMIFPFETNPNFAVPNQELFYRADAAEGIIYPENAQYKDNYQYAPEEVEEKESLDTKLTRLLKGIGVSVENLTTLHKSDDIKGVADTFNKVAYASLNNANVSTLPEEAAHMFVEFIEEHDKALFNKMMTDIPKYGIYKTVKEDYLPVYGNINDVKKEAIGKAIAEYIVGNQVDPNVGSLKTWFQQVLNKVKEVLAKFGILDESDYNNYFEITADRILKGDFTGVFQGRGTYYNAEVNTPLGLVDIRDMQLELRDEVDLDGNTSSHYYFNGRRIKQRVSEKIRDKRKAFKADSIAQEIGKKYGTQGHADLLNLWNIKLGKVPAESISVQTNPVVFARLSNLVDALYDQFPNAKWRTEVKIVDPDGNVAGTVDLMNEEEDGTVNIFDYKFREQASEFLTDTDTKQLGEYKRILRNSYGFKKFGQIRIIPIKTHYAGSLENKVLSDIEVGTNTYELVSERSYLNPLPARFEASKDERVNRTLQYLNEELTKTENRPTKGDAEYEVKKARIDALKQTIARLQITEDLTSLETLAENDRERMEYIMKKKDPTPNELYDLYQLKEHYRNIVAEGYTVSLSGEDNIPLTELSVFAQQNSNTIDKKLEMFFNEHEINIHRVNKPLSWWSKLTQLSDYDNNAFQAFNRLITKGFNQTEIKTRKEFSDIKSIVEQIRQEAGGKTGVDIYDPILKKDKNGKPTNRLISRLKTDWFDLHKSNWPANKKALLPYFNMDKWKEYYNPLEQDFLKRHAGLSEDALKQKLIKFRNGMEKSKGIGNPNSEYFTIPDKFLNEDYLKYVKNQPDSGLAKLYNKYIEINRFARENADVDVPLNLLPYVQKGTIEMLANDGFNIKNLTTNALEKLKTQEWETFEIDSNGQRVYKIPLRYKGTEFEVKEDQSHDLGEMLMLWTEAVNQNAYLRETHSTAQLYQLALKKSKEVILRNGNPVLENGELRLADTSPETIQKYQEYLNAYYYGVKNEDSDFDVLGFSGHKIVKTAMKYLSGNAIGLNIFSGFSNLTGGFAQMISLASKGSQFTAKQLGTAVTSLHDPKSRALFSLMDITNSQFRRDRIASLSANKVEGLISWDKLFILQQGGDWMIKNTLLSAMAQNYTIKEGKIVKKEGDEESLMHKINFGKDGKLEIQGFDLDNETNYFELLKFREKVNRIAAEVAGNISERDRVLANNTLVGQLLLQFRGWILPMANSRFGQLKYNSNLEEHQIGKYRSTFSALANKKIFQVAKEIIAEQSSPTFHAILEKKYEAARLLNENLTIEEFKKLYIENVRSTFTDIALIALVAALKIGMDDDDSSDDGLAKKVIYRGLARTASELSFWYDPDSALSIVKTPVPLLNLVTNTFNFLGASNKEAFQIVFGEEEDTKWGDKFVKLIPGISAYHKLLKEIDED
jgi:hypothetical protein